MAEPEDEVPSILLPCTICNRTFKPESLEKHAKVCEKNAAKKRKTFDSSKQRIQGTELAEFLPAVPKRAEKSPVRKPQSQWKEKHMEFVRAIRQARGVQSPGRRSLSTVEQSRPINHEQCPHCERNFGPKAFDRHIEWCKERKARIPSSPLTPANLLAKERLEARTKYRAPLSKSKRSITREKYSPTARGGIREPSPLGSRSTVNCSTMSITSSSSNQTVRTTAARTAGSAPSSQRSSARESVSSPSCGLQRNVTSRSSMQRRSSSPTKRPSLVRKDSAGGRGETGTQAQKKKATQDGLENLFSSSCNITRLSPHGKTNSKQVPVVNAARNKNKKNEVKSTRSPIHVNSNASPHHSKKGNIPGKHDKKTNGVPDLSPKDKPRTKQKQLVKLKPISSYEGSQVSQGVETANEFPEDTEKHIVSATDTALKLNKTPRKQNPCPKANKTSPKKCENSKIETISIKKDKISPQKDKFTKKILASHKISPKKDKSPKKVIQIIKNFSSQFQCNKINEITVNEDQIDITVSSCQIYPSKCNLVTWQELAVGTDMCKPSVAVELNQTYTVTESPDILKLDLPVSSCSISPVPCSPRQISGSGSLDQLSSDSLADDEKESNVSTRLSSNETLITLTHDVSDPIIENAVEENSSFNDIWDAAAQNFLKEMKDIKSCSIDSQVFYEGLDRTCLYSTPVKCELHNSFNCSESEGTYFGVCKEIEDQLTHDVCDRVKKHMKKQDSKLHSILKQDILLSRTILSKTWRRNFFLKEKWLAAKRKLSQQRTARVRNIKKRQECVLQGQPIIKRKKLKDAQADWSLRVVQPFLFCVVERKLPFIFQSGESVHKKFERCSKSEQNLIPKSNIDHSKMLSANNKQYDKPICQRRRKCVRYKNSVAKSNSQETRLINLQTKNSLSTDSLEREKPNLMGKDRDKTVTIEYIGSLNSETEISSQNSYSEERCNLITSESSFNIVSALQSTTEINSSNQLPNASITDVDTDREKTYECTKTCSLSQIKSEPRVFQSGKTVGNIEIHYVPSPRKHKQPQRKTKFPKIYGNVSTALEKNVSGGFCLNHSNSIYEEHNKTNKEEEHNGISLQKINRQIYELEDCKQSSLQEKLFLPDININCSSRREIGNRKQDKPSFWEHQTKVGHCHLNSFSDINAQRSIYSRNPNAKKLPPLYQSPSHRRGRFAMLKRENFTPNMPNVTLLLNSAIAAKEVYDPYVSAERQMMELLSGDWPAPTEIKNEQQEQEEDEEQTEKPEPSPPSPPPNELRTSPTSAFTKYSPSKPRPDSSETKPVSATSFHDTEDADQPARPESRKKLSDMGKIHIEDEHDGQVNRRSITSKVSGDSAYSSLNRKSPLADVQSERLDTDLRCLSSSGSESSLPPLCSVQVEGKSPTPLVESNAPKMSKFCHECGFKYPVTLAKFCCECGVKRLFV